MNRKPVFENTMTGSSPFFFVLLSPLPLQRQERSNTPSLPSQALAHARAFVKPRGQPSL